MYLNQNNLLNDIKGIVGTSVGSISSLIFVLFISKMMSIEDIKDTLFMIKIDELIGLHIKDYLTLPHNILMDYGILSKDNIKETVDNILEKYGKKRGMTFEQLYKKTNIELVVTWSNVSNGKIEFINHLNNPKMSIAEAIAISSSIPLMIKPTVIKNNYYCDGGLFCNQPLFYFDRIYNKKVNSFGFSVDQEYEKNNDILPINNFGDYLFNTINFLSNSASENYFKTNGIIDERLIRIYTNINATNVHLTQNDKENLICLGYNSLSNKFKNLTLDNHIIIDLLYNNDSLDLSNETDNNQSDKSNNSICIII